MALRVFCLCLSLLVCTMGPCAACWSDGRGSHGGVLPQPEALEWGLALCGLMTIPPVGPQGRRQEARLFHGQANMRVKGCPPTPQGAQASHPHLALVGAPGSQVLGQVVGLHLGGRTLSGSWQRCLESNEEKQMVSRGLGEGLRPPRTQVN